MSSTDKYCLKWNEFSIYICDSFRELRYDSNFCDVTLACDDGEQIKANKVVLSSCSPVLKNLLKSNPHPHPLLVLRGYKSCYLNQLIDFMYYGEVDVAQKDFDEFLRGAKDLQVQGLSEDNTGTSKSKQSTKCEKTKPPNSPTPVAPVKVEKPPSPNKILEVVKNMKCMDEVIDETTSKQTVPHQLQKYTNVTVTTIEDNVDSLKVEKQENKEDEDDEDDDEPVVFVSDSEDTEMASETECAETVENEMNMDGVVEKESSKEMETKNVSNNVHTIGKIMVNSKSPAVKKDILDAKQTIPIAKATVQPVAFAPITSYSEIPQVEIFVPASIAPQATPINQPDPLRGKVNKFVGHKLKQKEEDPILKMFSTRCAGGWTCTTCGQFHHQKDAMKGHIQTNHMNGFGHVCDNCGKSFRTRGRLLSHIDQTHACS